MNQTQIDSMKLVAATANAAYEAEKARLTDAGFKSQERYTMLKDLKAEADKTHAEYAKFAKGQISKELDKIIAAQTPAQRAEGLRRARS
jgi:hypothetical protein